MCVSVVLVQVPVCVDNCSERPTSAFQRAPVTTGCSSSAIEPPPLSLLASSKNNFIKIYSLKQIASNSGRLSIDNKLLSDFLHHFRLIACVEICLCLLFVIRRLYGVVRFGSSDSGVQILKIRPWSSEALVTLPEHVYPFCDFVFLRGKFSPKIVLQLTTLCLFRGTSCNFGFLRKNVYPLTTFLCLFESFRRIFRLRCLLICVSSVSHLCLICVSSKSHLCVLTSS